jgi:DNA-binding MurR/RpiR family transcriptional regulator
MATQVHPPESVEALREAIIARYDTLSLRLQQIARHLLDEPSDFALETLAVISERSGAQPSAIVRFAKTFGFQGASEIQRLFRDELLSTHAGLGYRERARRFDAELQGDPGRDDRSVLLEFAEGSALALKGLPDTVAPADFDAAIEALHRADTVYVIGFRRAFPVSSYLAYSLQRSGKRLCFVDGVGGLVQHQVATAGERDLLFAISYRPYSSETVAAVEAATDRGVPVIAMTDSSVSPIAKPAALTLIVKETEIRSFRSLTASLCLAQALSIGYALHEGRGAERI